ncbi:TPA: hypothetical protein BOS_12655 [Bos taurus]|nr:TPA: hypothetical protein BOS_12655 [Bos taurus]
MLRRAAGRRTWTLQNLGKMYHKEESLGEITRCEIKWKTQLSDGTSLEKRLFYSEAQEGSSDRHVPDLRLASDLELPELLCAGATPEVTAELLILYSYPDFAPSKPHLGTQAQGQRCHTENHHQVAAESRRPETHAPAPAESPDLFTVSSSR